MCRASIAVRSGAMSGLGGHHRGQVDGARIAAAGDHLHRVAAGEDAFQPGMGVGDQDGADAALAHALAGGLHGVGQAQHQGA